MADGCDGLVSVMEDNARAYLSGCVELLVSFDLVQFYGFLGDVAGSEGGLACEWHLSGGRLVVTERWHRWRGADV